MSPLIVRCFIPVVVSTLNDKSCYVLSRLSPLPRCDETSLLACAIQAFVTLLNLKLIITSVPLNYDPSNGDTQYRERVGTGRSNAGPWNNVAETKQEIA